MDELRAYYRGSLTTRIETLEQLRGRDDEDAHSSIRRIARALEGTGASYGFGEISQAAASLLAAPEEGLPAATDALIETLRGVASSESDEAATILLVEDDPTMREVLQSKLSGPNRRIVTAATATEAEALVEENGIDLVLLDLLLPDEDGRNLLSRLRANPRYTTTPILVLSSLDGSQAKAECYALGADEYFVKPPDLEALSAAVATKLLRAGEISREARLDPLTGVLNRAGVRVAFEHAQALAQRAGYLLSLAMADLDGLKRINDSCGHALGDRVLRRVSKILVDTLRRSDRVARWGGDEFVILFPDGNPTGASKALEKVLEKLGRESFSCGGEPFKVAFSAGVTGVAPGAGLDEVVERADEILYLAKAAGGSRVLTAEHRPKARRQRILVAEADGETSAELERHLAAAGFEVVRCDDGSSALQAALASEIDLAILDVMRPEGFDLLDRLRETPIHASTPVMMLTAVDDEEEILRAFDRGADDYVLKPFSPPELVARVRRMLKRSMIRPRELG